MRKLFFVLFLVVVLASAFFFFRLNVLERIRDRIDSARENTAVFVTETLPEKLTHPEPLRVFRPVSGNLTIAGTLAATNEDRIKEGLRALSLHTALNVAAQKKVNDMFARQYFEHIAPDGRGASDLAAESGYAYVIIGENLAMGNFKDDRDLVTAWMESPGHRANILNKRFIDIGIAVAKGRFVGKEVWLAVQTFGMPASACLSPSASLKAKIAINQVELDRRETELSAKKAQIESSRSNRSEYEMRVEEYNSLVGEYNALAQETKDTVSIFNAEVRAYNTCIQN